MPNLRFLAFFFVFNLMCLEKANGMGFLDSIRVCTFSEIEGVVTLSGKTLEGAKVEAISDYRGARNSRIVNTDMDGRFRFESTYSWSLAGIMMDVNVFQSIVVTNGLDEVLVWKTVKENGRFLGELGSEVPTEMKKISVRCELSDSNTRKVVRSLNGFNSIRGVCRWDGDAVVDHENFPSEIVNVAV